MYIITRYICLLQSFYCIYFMFKYNFNIFEHITHLNIHNIFYQNYMFVRAQYISANF